MNQELESLMNRYMDGAISLKEAAELNTRLRADAQARRSFAEMLNLDSTIAAAAAGWRPEAMSCLPESRRPTKTVVLPFVLHWLAAAATILLGMGVFWWSHRGVEIEVVQNFDAAPADWAAGRKMRVEHVTIVRGSLQLRLSSGVKMDVTAPAEMRLLDPMHVRVLYGRVTADVGEHGKGFVIETPQTKVVDLGTRFGVDASNAAHTDVVVFEGQVELYEKGVSERVALLNKGEGLRVGSHRRASRIVSVTGPDELNAWSAQSHPAKSAVITAVTDSMVTNDEGAKKWPSLRNFYRIVPAGLRDGALAFADEIDQWQAVPPSLAGADLVRTFAVDGFNWWMQMSVIIQQPAEVFVFVDMRNEVPAWLSQNFTNTGEKITLNRISHQAPQRVADRFEFAVWKKTVTQPGEVKLGAPYPNPPADKKSFQPNRMFGVAAKTLP